MRDNKKKIIGIIITCVVLSLFVGLIVYNALGNKLRYNEKGDVANTTGNLYNGGYFCEYKGYVYFANKADVNSLYRMKDDGTKVEKLHPDSVSHIQDINDYIYYVRSNETSADVVLRGQPYGIFRLEIGEEKAEQIYNGVVLSMRMLGNDIYFQSYTDKNEDKVQLKKIKIDGTGLETLSDEDYDPICVNGTDIYFTEVRNSHNLMRLDTNDDRIITASEGNYYMPTFVNGAMYYIDLTNGMQLTKVNLSNNESVVLDDGKCINYNVSEENNVIYYQLENEDVHQLCRMALSGDNKVVVADGDCMNIHITKNYTYFYKITGVSVEDVTLYRAKTNGASVQEVNFSKED